MTPEGEDLRKLPPKDRLRHLRDDWSDEIPDEIIHSTSPNKAFKVRVGWFQGVTATLEAALEQIDDPALEAEVTRFVNYYTSDVFKAQELTKASDIFAANRIINRVLGEEVQVAPGAVFQ